jgi:hypothetical protein
LGSAKRDFGLEKGLISGEKSAKLPFFHEHFQKLPFALIKGLDT